MAKAKTTTTLGLNEFEVNGKLYKFVIFQFIVPGFEEGTALEAKTNPDLLAYLVAEKSGVIEEVA